MTEILQRPAAATARPSPAQPSGAGERPPRPPLVAGARAALLAGALGLLAVALPVLLLQAADPRAGGSVADALRTAGQLHLLAHGAALEVPAGRVALSPLGLLLLPLLLLARAGRAVCRGRRATSVGAAVRAALTVAAPYTALLGAVALLSRTRDVQPDGVSAVLHGGAVALVGATAGALRVDRLWRSAWLRLGEGTRRLLRGVLAGTAVLVAGGALLVGGSLAVHLSRGAELAAATAPGPVAGAGLLLVGLSLVPNAVVWAVSWLAGPGFAVGAGTAVGPFGHDLGAVPAVPLLAALPGGPVPVWLGVLALLVPVAAGAVTGAVLHRSVVSGAVVHASSRLRALADAVAAGAGCGIVWAALAWSSGGAVGGLRLAEVGPSPWRTGLAVAAEVAGGALVARLVLARRS